MAYQLRLEEILQALQRVKHPETETYIAAFEALTQSASEALASALEIEVGQATYDFGFIAAPFSARYAEQPLPPSIDDFDTAEEWNDSLPSAPGY